MAGIPEEACWVGVATVDEIPEKTSDGLGTKLEGVPV